MSQPTIEETLQWVVSLHAESEKELTYAERKEQEKYAILVQRPTDKILLSKMLDESSQIRNDKRLAKRIKVLIDKYGVPEFFNTRDKLLLRLFAKIGYLFDPIAIPIFKKRLHSDTAGVIIDEDRPYLTKHLAKRAEQKTGQNVNLLGEVVLGDGEALHRYEHYLEALEAPDINYISIKVSGIYAQLQPLNYVQSKKDLCHRVATIYQKAIDFPYVDAEGVSTAKFVNLDMEEYKDAELTLDVFKTVLSMPQFKEYKAGIVIQAYLTDAWLLQSELLDFAKQRVADGGSPLKMRLVKGANLQMESVMSSLKGWENPILPSKVMVDANYLHILDRALEPENAAVVSVGVASHNLYTIGYAYLTSMKNKVSQYVTFEMLEGMANNLCRAMKNLGNQIILYTPVVKDEHFLNAVSYLVRRLDENTGKENFLSYSFNLKPDSKEWDFLYAQFIEAYNMKDELYAHSTRTQNRNEEPERNNCIETFESEPDTNFELPQNRVWVDGIVSKWKKSSSDIPKKLHVYTGAIQERSDKSIQYIDHSQTDRVVTFEMEQATLEQVKRVIDIASNDSSNWSNRTPEERQKILMEVAMNLARHRGDLIGCATAVTGKTVTEGDVEISEAIDFCRFYPLAMKEFDNLSTVECTAKGVVLVIPPWNFPIAIPIGGVAAALCSGNRVILKPATASAPIAWEFAKCFWEAGVPHEALQVVCPQGRDALTYLTSHQSIKHIIFTGGTETAFNILESNPTCAFSAETGGKNVILVTGNGDRDHAILNIVSSAFSNAGQKCSACSLLFLEKEIYNDPIFKTKLIDAVTSMQTGSSWELNNIIGPMVTNNNDKLLHAIANLDKGEEWLIKPEFLDSEKYILKPCVKWGVRPGNYTYDNEIFAPLLSVVCIDSLEQGVEYLDKLEFGLTSGLQSLDESEQEYWKEHVEAGNLYINRGITGAIVNRQPFGGMKLSAFGGGIKAGGVNYVSCFVDVKEKEIDKTEYSAPFHTYSHISNMLSEKERTRYDNGVNSYIANYDNIFSKEVDVNNLYGESNIFRYLPLDSVVLRVYVGDKLDDIALTLTASQISRTFISVSVSDEYDKLSELQQITKELNIDIVVEGIEQFISKIGNYSRIRTCSSNIDIAIFKEAAKTGLYIATAPPVIEGRLELLHYLKEQSISFEYHRYGSISEDLDVTIN